LPGARPAGERGGPATAAALAKKPAATDGPEVDPALSGDRSGGAATPGRQRGDSRPRGKAEAWRRDQAAEADLTRAEAQIASESPIFTRPEGPAGGATPCEAPGGHDRPPLSRGALGKTMDPAPRWLALVQARLGFRR